MNTDKSCRLCLGDPSVHNETTPEDDELRCKIDKIFYFQVVRSCKIPLWICASCVCTINSFYVYAESVLFNQQIIKSKESSGLEDQRPTDKINIKSEPLIEWNVAEADVYCESKDIKKDIKEQSDDDERVSAVSDEGSGSDHDDNSSSENSDERSPKRKKKSETAKPERRKNPNEDKVLEHYTLSCDLCAKKLKSFKELNKHFKVVHYQEPYIVCCEKKIFRSWVMIEHLQLHVDPHSFRCDICSKDYSSSRVLKEHVKEVHSSAEARSFKCEVCQKAFAQRSHLNAHIQVSHGSFQCPQCPSMLVSKKSLTKHIQMMHGEGDQFVCDVCARVFRYKQGFDKHVRSHLGTRAEEKVQCTECSSWFTDQNCLRKHIKRAHEVSEIPLECQVCGWHAQNKPSLTRHMHQAHRESKFECEYCGKKFKRQHHMKEHVAIHHTGAALYTCTYCSEPFNSKNKLYTHRKTVHPAEYEEELHKRHMKDVW